MCLELVVFGSLVTNRAAVERVKSAFAKADVKAARKAVKNANKDYWPKALVAPIHDTVDFTTIRPGSLLENDWATAHGFLSTTVRKLFHWAGFMRRAVNAPKHLGNRDRRPA